MPDTDYKPKNGRPPEYPWADMPVGGEFTRPMSKFKSMRRLALYQKHKFGREFEITLRPINGRRRAVCKRVK